MLMRATVLLWYYYPIWQYLGSLWFIHFHCRNVAHLFAFSSADGHLDSCWCCVNTVLHMGETLVRADSEKWGCWVIGYMYFHCYQIVYVFFNSEHVSIRHRGNEGCLPLHLTGPPPVLQTCLVQPSHSIPSGSHRSGPLAADSSPASLFQWHSWVRVGGGWEWGSGNQIWGPQRSPAHKPQCFSSTLRGRGTCRLHTSQAPSLQVPRHDTGQATTLY